MSLDRRLGRFQSAAIAVVMATLSLVGFLLIMRWDPVRLTAILGADVSLLQKLLRVLLAFAVWVLEFCGIMAAMHFGSRWRDR